MKKSAKIAIIVLISFVIFCAFLFSKRESEKPLAASSDDSSTIVPATANGSIVLKSFQSTEKSLGASQSRDLQREPASEKKGFKKLKSNNSKGITGIKTVKVDGTSYIWFDSLIAKRNQDNIGKSNSPDGFEIISTVPMKNFGVYDENALHIVTDKFGFERRVITGVLIVELQDINVAGELAKSHQIDVSYLAPQIHTALLHVRNGQNIFEKEIALRNSPNVKSVKLEILGKGATIK